MKDFSQHFVEEIHGLFLWFRAFTNCFVEVVRLDLTILMILVQSLIGLDYCLYGRELFLIFLMFAQDPMKVID